MAVAAEVQAGVRQPSWGPGSPPFEVMEQFPSAICAPGLVCIHTALPHPTKPRQPGLHNAGGWLCLMGGSQLPWERRIPASAANVQSMLLGAGPGRAWEHSCILYETETNRLSTEQQPGIIPPTPRPTAFTHPSETKALRTFV